MGQDRRIIAAQEKGDISEDKMISGNDSRRPHA
jgi:hypothetical protein